MEPNWSSLPEDLLIAIANRILSLENYVVFGSVCRSWRSAAPKENFNSSNHQLLPWLMLRQTHPDLHSQPQTPKIYSLTNHRLYRIPHPPHRSYCTANSILSSLGWIMAASNHHRNDISLFHPLSPDHQIRLPLRNINVVYKFALSSRPSLAPPRDFAVVAIDQSSDSAAKNQLSFWRPGRSSWARIRAEEPVLFLDVVHFNGRFYAVDRRRRVLALSPDRQDRDRRMVSVVSELNLPKSEAPFLNPYDVEMLYLVESEGALLVVQGDRQWWGHGNRETTEFRVFEVNVNDGSFWKVESLGDRALFLGDKSSSFSIKASDFLGCKCNCIYFADDFRKLDNFGVRSKDIGVFDMKDGKLERFFGFENRESEYLTPLWVQPSFLCE
ncbi:F-box domain containing protein [Trema orientale]|uniref:F-box domain containing protein n=1 Tax=Trema orientale TaxID=63057 RepID=A0A2P5EGC3_TREOI|nr:F-box domain containing protein [Trema orientale]